MRTITLGGVKRNLSLTYGDLETIEDRIGEGIGTIVERFRKGGRLKDTRIILEVALERVAWKGTSEEVRAMIVVEGPVPHMRNCGRLMFDALEPMPGGNSSAPATEETE